MASHSASPSPASPAPGTPASGSASPAPTPAHSKPKSKPPNLFSNDGSFLERFQRIKKEESEKKSEEDKVTKKRTFDDRFKNRGKRPAPSTTNDVSGTGSTASAESGGPSKKPKTDKVLSQYEKEVQSYESRSLKDQGMGVRPLVK